MDQLLEGSDLRAATQPPGGSARSLIPRCSFCRLYFGLLSNDTGWYTQHLLAVKHSGSDQMMQALAYFGSAARLVTDTVHHGPLAEYTEAHQALYRKHL